LISVSELRTVEIEASETKKTLESLPATERRAVTLTASEKYVIADEIVTENRSKTDVVQDVFDEIAERFDIRRRG
jgi:ribosomal protein L17